MAEKQLHPLDPERMKFANTFRNVHVAFPPAGTPADDLLEPRYWAHLAMTMNEADRIEATEETKAWYAEFVVLSVGRLSAEVHRTMFHDLSKRPAAQPEQSAEAQCEVKWGGPFYRWTVRRSGEIIESKLQSRGQANRWLEEYLQAQAR